MKWYYLLCGIISMILIVLGIVLGNLEIISARQSAIVEIVGWVLVLAISIARVVEMRRAR